jgi:hypothetical protein
MTITLSLAGVSLAVLVAAIAAWGRHRKRQRHGCGVARQAVERMQAAINSGVRFAGYGAFSAEHSSARDDVISAARQVVDKKLRRLLEALVTAYDHTEAAALPVQSSDPERQLRAPLRAVAADFDSTAPHHRLKALPGETLERIHFLERKSAAY